jgi:exosortase B
MTKQNELTPVGLPSWLPFVILVVGLGALFAPTYKMLIKDVWSGESEMHGPIVLAVAIWIFWKLRTQLLDFAIGTTGHSSQAKWVGWPVLALGLVAAFVGRVGEVPALEVFSQPIVLAGAILLLTGIKGLRASIFPVIFLFFMVPLPGNLIDAMTGPLKQSVSVVAESILYHAGYPIARSGVMITIGQYQLLVADACSGLKSIFSLSAVGIIYIYLVGHTNKVRIAVLLASLVPIAFVANIIRVIILILVTYHFGDDAAQGFLHEFAGMILFMLALSLLMALDGVCGTIFKNRKPLGQKVVHA